MRFPWVLTVIGCLTAIVYLGFGILNATSAIQEASVGAVAVALAVIPYCLARALNELRLLGPENAPASLVSPVKSRLLRNSIFVLVIFAGVGVALLAGIEWWNLREVTREITTPTNCVTFDETLKLVPGDKVTHGRSSLGADTILVKVTGKDGKQKSCPIPSANLR